MFILKIVSYIFFIFVKLRILLYQVGILKSYKINNCKVISIGNISFGGTGKTPVTIEIANNLIYRGYKVAVLLRGYKRKSKDKIKVVSDGKNITSDPFESGDEAFLIAKKVGCPVIVAKNRVKGANYIVDNFNVDFILLDDGFQHLRIKRDKDIVLLTEENLNEPSFLVNKFREPLAHIKRADLIIITKITDYKKINRKILEIKNIFNKEIYTSKIILKNFIDIKTDKVYPANYFEGKKCGIFCGIAKPEYFKELLLEHGIIVDKEFLFPDHYYLQEKDYSQLNESKDIPFITTEKDAVKLNIERLNNQVFIAEIRYSFKKF